MPDVRPIPEGYTPVTPMLIASPAEELITFIKEVFGAEERLRMPMPNGQIGHCELIANGGLIMVADVMEPFEANRTGVHVYVDDVDATYAKATAKGGTSLMAPDNMFYGDRTSAVRDPFGNVWNISKHVEDVSEADMQTRVAGDVQGSGHLGERNAPAAVVRPGRAMS